MCLRENVVSHTPIYKGNQGGRQANKARNKPQDPGKFRLNGFPTQKQHGIKEENKKVKLSLLLEQGVSWEFMEAKIQEEIDSTFDDEKFVKMDPDFRVDAAYARKEFGDKKPVIVDYILWMGKFVTKSDYVEW